MSFGTRMRKIRHENGYTQTDIFELTGIPQTNISLWERDKGSPNVLELPMLAKALNCSINDLIGEEDENEQITNC